MTMTLYEEGGLNPDIITEIREFFTTHKEESHTTKQVCKSLGIQHKGTDAPLRAAIKILNEQGLPIISDNQGFKYTENKEEIKKYVHNLRSRAREINKRAEQIETSHLPRPMGGLGGQKEEAGTETTRTVYHPGLCPCGMEITLNKKLCKYCEAAEKARKRLHTQSAVYLYSRNNTDTDTAAKNDSKGVL